jgi:hypothetical protein
MQLRRAGTVGGRSPTGGMRFRGSVEFWVHVTNVDQAEQVVQAAERAAYASLGGTAIDDPESGAVSGHF